jgi:AraC-like DNA-binding protein
MASPDLRISHAGHLVPYVEFLDGIGSPIGLGLERMRLPGNLMEIPDCYVPARSVFGFVGYMANKEGIDDLGFRVAYEKGLGLLAPTLGMKVCSGASLHDTMQRFCAGARVVSSNVRSWVVEGNEEVRFYIRRPLEPGTPGYTQTEWISVVVMIGMVQLFAGPRWQPHRISLRTKKGVPPLARETFGNTRFLTAQPEVSIAFSPSLLALPRFREAGERRLSVPPAPDTPYGAVEPAADFVGRLTQCVMPHFGEGYPSIRLAAEIAGTSVRTLQRRLAEQGLNYGDVVSRARFDVASNMLTQTDAPVIEVAFATGYSDPSHFARAFRRLAGVSPREFRAAALQSSAE